MFIIFLALNVEKVQGSMLIDYGGRVITLGIISVTKVNCKNSEINVAHGALFFECSSIMKFPPYQKIA